MSDNIDEILNRIQAVDAPTKSLRAILDILDDLTHEVRRVENRVIAVEKFWNHP